jgi:hypothetical protein
MPAALLAAPLAKNIAGTLLLTMGTPVYSVAAVSIPGVVLGLP